MQGKKCNMLQIQNLYTISNNINSNKSKNTKMGIPKAKTTCYDEKTENKQY
jgi:hypothetical protein